MVDLIGYKDLDLDPLTLSPCPSAVARSQLADLIPTVRLCLPVKSTNPLLSSSTPHTQK